MTATQRPLHLCFGGTFDPVHNGHLRVLWETTLALQADTVRLLPCYIPPHKDLPESSATHRLGMLHLAIQDQPQWRLDERELTRGKPSYTIDTLLDLRRDLGQDAALVWLLGMDSFAALDSWHRWEELGEHAHLAVVGRPGSVPPINGPVADWASTRWIKAERLRESAAGALVHVAATQQDIASSNLRAGMRAGVAPRYLMPDAVCTYIVKHRLYC